MSTKPHTPAQPLRPPGWPFPAPGGPKPPTAQQRKRQLREDLASLGEALF